MCDIKENNSRHFRDVVLPYVLIARPDHWFKNVFVVPGIIVAYGFHPALSAADVNNIVWGFISISLIASSNYIINEVLDAPYDIYHPHKKNRPIPAGMVILGIAYTEWLVLMTVGLAIAYIVSFSYVLAMLSLWIMGCVYNIRPLRTKEKPIVDVLSEAVNNPIRLLAGWFMISPDTIPPLSLIISYWCIGCFFMAIKRFSEYRIFEEDQHALYRSSFRFYTEPKLMVSIMFYASAAMLFFGLFVARYRLELVLSFPMVALVMAYYLALGFQKDSIVQTPEKLYKNPVLILLLVLCVIVMTAGMLIDMPLLYKIFVSSPLSIPW